jgi:hypothetical protein
MDNSVLFVGGPPDRAAGLRSGEEYKDPETPGLPVVIEEFIFQ